MTRPRRSMHFVPGGNEKMLAKSLGTKADCLILDLEDAVTPARKAEVRDIVAGWLRDVDFGTKETAVRINPLDTPWGYADLAETMLCPPDLYVVPKPETLEAVKVIDEEIGRLERQHGHPPGQVGLVPIAGETPRGVLNITALAGCPRVAAMTWGAEDLATALGASGNRDEGNSYLSPYQHARVTTLLSAVAAGVQPIDTVYANFRDSEGFLRDCREGAAMGFTGKMSIHPDQIDPINAAFAPSPEQVAEARALIEAFEAAQAEGRMAFSFNGAMVDAPHLNRARAVLERARQIEESKT